VFCPKQPSTKAEATQLAGVDHLADGGRRARKLGCDHLWGEGAGGHHKSSEDSSPQQGLAVLVDLHEPGGFFPPDKTPVLCREPLLVRIGACALKGSQGEQVEVPRLPGI
jgi:hypothetical protein